MPFRSRRAADETPDGNVTLICRYLAVGLAPYKPQKGAENESSTTERKTCSICQ